MSICNEWLETDGLGGYAMGVASGPANRRYHGILIAPIIAPAVRFVLVNSLEATLSEEGKTTSLSSFRFWPGVVTPEPQLYHRSFAADPWPKWIFETVGGGSITFELFMPRGATLTVLSWKYDGPRNAVLQIRPLISVRDHHALHFKNPYASLHSRESYGRTYWKPYADAPEIVALSNGAFKSDPYWYENFELKEEAARGFPSREDLIAPGTFSFDVAKNEAVLIFGEAHRSEKYLFPKESCTEAVVRLRASETARRAAHPSLIDRAAEDFIVRRGKGLTILAGYPWFTDWGRDTFISLRGLCIARKKLDEALGILLQWTTALSQGMMPNRFLDDKDSASESAAEYNSVDASLWFVVAVYELLECAKTKKTGLTQGQVRELASSVEVILQNYSQGTRYGIKSDSDGLLISGSPGTQLTWMDAKVGDYVVTPRSGKPVEIQALWLNALKIGTLLLPQSKDRWNSLFERGIKSFSERFWNQECSCLYDVIDNDKVFGSTDARIRPNQLFALGGLPFPIFDLARGKKVVDTVEKLLFTPVGIRTLAPGERGYAARYEGNPDKRNFAYHQGTAWPYLMGAFVEAWIRVRGSTTAVKESAYQLFVAPLLTRPDIAAHGHIPEIADAEEPFMARGCPFQAWSLSEIIRLKASLQQWKSDE